MTNLFVNKRDADQPHSSQSGVPLHQCTEQLKVGPTEGRLKGNRWFSAANQGVVGPLRRRRTLAAQGSRTLPLWTLDSEGLLNVPVYHGLH